MGVSELIARIRDEGVQSGRQEADRLLSEARQEAARIVAEAQREADEALSAARNTIQLEQEAALESLKLAFRDTGLDLKRAVVAGFEEHVRRLVSDVTLDGKFLRSLILVLAGHSAEEYIEDRDAKILISEVFVGGREMNPEEKETTRHAALAISNEMLRKGIELIPTKGMGGGAKVCLVGEAVEIDLSEAAVSQLILKHLLPRFRAILEGLE
jgi:V/A-type H+-transporting ATPase subunit E